MPRKRHTMTFCNIQKPWFVPFALENIMLTVTKSRARMVRNETFECTAPDDEARKTADSFWSEDFGVARFQLRIMDGSAHLFHPDDLEARTLRDMECKEIKGFDILSWAPEREGENVKFTGNTN